jgi:hypothetical protein
MVESLLLVELFYVTPSMSVTGMHNKNAQVNTFRFFVIMYVMTYPFGGLHYSVLVCCKIQNF